MARPERFELPTYSSGGCRSIQLSYGRANFSLHPDSRPIKCQEVPNHRIFNLPGEDEWGTGRLPAVASTATAFTTSAPTAATAPLWLGTRFVHIQGAPTHLRAVQRSDRLFSIFRVRHLH